MRSLFTLVQLFTFIDWVIAAFISGTAAKIEGRDKDGKPTGKRTALAVGLATFFAGMSLLRIVEFLVGSYYVDALRFVMNQLPQGFKVALVGLAAGKTIVFLFCWFAVTMEVRERKGIASGYVIRNTLAKLFERFK